MVPVGRIRGGVPAHTAEHVRFKHAGSPLRKGAAGNGGGVLLSGTGSIEGDLQAEPGSNHRQR